MGKLPLTDVIIIVVYLAALVLTGVYFAIRHKTASHFTYADGRLPAWVVGLSIFGTYLSSNTFIGVTGRAFASDWNAFVFSLSLPVAAWLAARYFVPFYRRTGHISAYEHLEKRFGAWARIYMVAGYLLTQLARMGSIMFGVALVLQALLGLPLNILILSLGLLVTLYTLLGGIEAVIWTDVVQSIILTAGAVVIVILLFIDIPGGWETFIEQGLLHDKFSLGSLKPDFTQSTFWVVLLYGLFINLNNFGIDQSFIQRYHTARSESGAARSVWMSVRIYIPISFLFFVIGTGLWVYYQSYPEYLEPVKERIVAKQSLESTEGIRIGPESVDDTMIGDRAFPEYIVTRLPAGFTGLLIAALIAASMSSLDTSLNSSATILWSDIYKRYLNKTPDEKTSMRVLHLGTLSWGLAGTFTGLALTGVKSILDAWWQLSGIFAGGMLGLFLLGLISRRTGNTIAVLSVCIGIVIITGMTFMDRLPESLAFLRPGLHSYMIVVTGTLSIFLSGLIITFVVKWLSSGHE